MQCASDFHVLSPYNIHTTSADARDTETVAPLMRRECCAYPAAGNLANATTPREAVLVHVVSIHAHYRLHLVPHAADGT